MKKFLLTLIAVFGLVGAANAQDSNVSFINFDNDSQFDVSLGRTGFGDSDGYGVGAWHIGASYDFADGKFKVAPELDVVFWDGTDIFGNYVDYGTSLMPGLELGHDNIFLIASVDSQEDNGLLLGVGGEINVGSSLSLDISYQQGSGVYADTVAYFQFGLSYNF